MSEKKIDWKIYESITKYIYETLGREFGVKIKCYGNKCKVIGRSGLVHQIDVLTSLSDGVHTYLTAIECKYWNKKVNKDIVMKLAKTIEDSGINKGVIVSKNGFTKDCFEYAKNINIELVELREIQRQDLNRNSQEIQIGDLKLNINSSIKRTEILDIKIDNYLKINFKSEFELFDFFIIKEDKSYKSLTKYIAEFRKDVNPENKKTEILIKKYLIPNGILFNRQTNESFKINEISFTGQLRNINDNKIMNFTLIDKVWLIMKSIFNERTFIITETGLIKENKKS